MRLKNLLAPTLLLAFAATAGSQTLPRRAMTFQDFAAVRAVADPQLPPDGRTVLYTVRVTDVDANRRIARTYAVPAAGGAARQFPASDVDATEARWSPDGRRVAYITGGQLWIADADGGNRKQLTTLNGGATGPVWAPTGGMLAFTSAVYPACATDACNVARDKARDTSKVKAYIADQLLYRHWNVWDAGTRSHLFVVSADGGEPRDLIPGATYDVPPPPFGGSEAYTFSPDGREIAYTAKDQGRNDATSTDLNLYLVPAAGGASTVITAANRGADMNPVYTPDGRYIAYGSQARAGFESDRVRLMFWDRQARTSREILPRWDRNADSYRFASDMSTVYVSTIDAGRDKLFAIPLRNGVAGTPAMIIGENNNAQFSFDQGARTVAWVRDATERPAEVWVGTVANAASAVGARQLTHENDLLVGQLSLNPAEDFTFMSGGMRVHGFVVKPPNFQPGRKYPTVLLIHGGPQGAWLDQWHSRWNYQMFAARGFGLVIINPRGSFGYGQRLVDDVSRDWGGKVYNDLMRGLDTALARNAWMDRNALGMAGGSFGGYMVNWILGHSTRFKAAVSHAGVFNLEAMAGATEELWFTDWEFGRFTDPAMMATQYRRFSPHLHARNFRTPTLVTQGELDFRVPSTESMQLFTALQRNNVPSRLIVFPDEGHWIAKPQNQRLWWNEVQGWLGKYLAPGVVP
ncbi:MAG TPA: S9 family peptidase [Gemmatimonadaceae bacterium]|nr:S9 family peptidase [Gemmatimonadaceae bacterium]